MLSGGPSSVYEPGAPTVDPKLFTSGVPVFGMCYGFQAMARALGGEVAPDGTREYGRTELTVADDAGSLLGGLPARHPVWMSHGDSVVRGARGFHGDGGVGARGGRGVRGPGAAAGRRAVPPRGRALPARPAGAASGSCTTSPGSPRAGRSPSIIEDTVAAIREQIGDGRAICGLSGGVDSAVAAALVQRAIGDRLTCVFVDHGLLRAGEREQVEKDFVAATGARLHTVDARERFLTALAGVTDPETKRKTIGREFIRVFEAGRSRRGRRAPTEHVGFLVQGTLYPDVVESGGGSGTATIKSHHNVGGLPDDIEFALVEPLRALFKDEVRKVGAELGLPDEIVHRQPFPGPGLGIRIIGEVTAERLATLRDADAIAREELTYAGLDREIWQCPVVLLADVRSVGVQGDGRTYGHPVVLRPVSSEDAMTADWTRLPYDVLERISTRITNEVAEVNRVVLDVTSKPPGTIEWE